MGEHDDRRGGLAAAVCSIARTARRRFFWALWSTGAPTVQPFRKPDASNGGSLTRDEARSAAEKAAKRPIVEIDPRWARAWSRVLRGQPPFASRDAAPSDDAQPTAARAKAPAPASIPACLGLGPHATVVEIKRAFRALALTTHPDHGGDAAAFREIHAAYEEALARAKRRATRPAKRRPPA